MKKILISGATGMIYMPDCIDAAISLMRADGSVSDVDRSDRHFIFACLCSRSDLHQAFQRAWRVG